jgi:hypothetical protein
MADTSFPNSVESPGLYYSQDFSLKSLNFLTANGEKIELKRVMTEFSYYEDIYSFCASGYITITDAQENGFISQLVNSNTWIGASDATVNRATPEIGTTCVCIATNDAPNTPAPNRHLGNVLAETAVNISLKPTLTSFLKSAINETNTKPVENETIAASRLSPIWAESSPLIRD